jgi:nitroreductase
MDMLSALEARRSAKKLVEPAPTRTQLEQILRAGANAPDHGRLRPWRFVVMRGAALQRFGESMAEAFQEKVPSANAEQIAKERAKALRAPIIIAVAARVTRNKIPEVEQLLSAGAAVENMFLAARSLGYGAMWKTGDVAYNPKIKEHLGLAATDHIVAFLYIGTEAVAGDVTPISLDGLVTWLGSP